MQVLTDAQRAKFEAVIVAVKIRGARPRVADRRTIAAIIWRLDNGAKWRSIPAELDDWPHAYLGVGRCVACGMRSWRMWWRRESRNWRLPASTARSRAHIRRRAGRGRANPSAGSAIHSHRRVSGGGAGAVERWAWHQDRRRVRCRRAAGRFPADAGPGARIGSCPSMWWKLLCSVRRSWIRRLRWKSGRARRRSVVARVLPLLRFACSGVGSAIRRWPRGARRRSSG